MGNVCSSGPKKKDDNSSEKSVDGAYQSSDTKKDTKETKQTSSHDEMKKEAPLADPEPISDISTGQNVGDRGAISGEVSGVISPTKNGNLVKQHMKINSSGTAASSAMNTPQTTNAPCELPLVSNLPSQLVSLHGNPLTWRRTENDKKIVLYILASNDNHKLERNVLHTILPNLQKRCHCRGYEIVICDPHHLQTDSKSDDDNHNSSSSSSLNVRKWWQSPLEAQGGHEEAANCLSEISRHSNSSYILPLLFLGDSLGTPLLPLTIESQDFQTVLNSNTDEKSQTLLKRWYILDNTAQPSCYRLNAKDISQTADDYNEELKEILQLLAEIFSKELRDSYLTTVVEQEINNTVLISQELSKRCIWIQTGLMPPKMPDNPTSLHIEMNRRLNNIHAELKNQLLEKNLIRVPPTINIPEEQLITILENLLISIMDGIFEEHSVKYCIPNCTFGVDKRLLSELAEVSQRSKLLGQNCANYTNIETVKKYLLSDQNSPLIIYGPRGSGKSILAAKIMQNIHSWLPEYNLILRYCNLTDISSHITALLGSIAEQLSFLISSQHLRINHELNSYVDFIKANFESTKLKIALVLDSIDEIDGLEEDVSWLPINIPNNIKIILTLTANDNNNELGEGAGGAGEGEDNALLNELKKLNIPKSNFVELVKFSDKQWFDVLNFGGGAFYAANGALHLPEKWKNSEDKLPLQAKILWWLAWLGNYEDVKDTKLPHIIDIAFKTIESKLSFDIIAFLLSIIIASEVGLKEIDIISLFQEAKLIKSSQIQSIWHKFCWLMGPILLHSNRITIMDSLIKIIATERYKAKVNEAHKILLDYFKKQKVIWTEDKGKHCSFNIEVLMQLPFQTYQISTLNKTEQSFITSQFLTDLSWIHDKLTATGCVQVLSDIYLIEKYLKTTNKSLDVESITPTIAHIKLLKSCLQIYKCELNYDGHQLFRILKETIEDSSRKDASYSSSSEILTKWKNFINNINSTYLEALNYENFCDLVVMKKDVTSTEKDDLKKPLEGYDIIMNLGGKGYFVASISTEREEISVWDVPKCRKVRTLKGVLQPTSLCPVGEYDAAVLCRREIKVIDLNEGKFKVTLKGVMNQKMPYFGLHDPKHLVCLSRNRMYVNLMNLESGDCVTTFKAGEDRFLNSLLVSGDGRILVCGDETQKPFPLLVWHLSQRKLLYDLRIPHHDFITSLSAITYEGSYVCVVAKELNEPTPNFIVVYDLQSGTLFKKWKPSCNTVSLAISQTNACVIAGLEDARILIWDLVTGNCRCNLIGHNAPVTLLKLDPTGKILLSGDKEARDISIRLWELDFGKSLAAYTPPAKISTCEILANGKYVVLALENYPNLLTLKLQNYEVEQEDSSENSENSIYGNPENEGKVFNLQQS